MPGGFYLDAAVETDREKVESALYSIVSDYRQKDRDAVVAAISTKSIALKAAAGMLIGLYNFENERVTDVSIDETAEGFDSHFRLNADFLSSTHGSLGRRPTRWIVHWIHEDETWKVRDATRLNPVTGDKLSGWDRLKP